MSSSELKLSLVETVFNCAEPTPLVGEDKYACTIISQYPVDGKLNIPELSVIPVPLYESKGKQFAKASAGYIPGIGPGKQTVQRFFLIAVSLLVARAS